MSVLIFADDRKKYHYPPDPVRANDATTVTLCGRKAKKNDPAILAEDVQTDMQPCPECAEIQTHDMRFVGRVI